MSDLKKGLESNQTLRKLRSLKEPYLSSVRFKSWVERTKTARERYLETLENADFRNGSDLTEEELSDMFKQLKQFSSNRSLNSLLWTENGIDKFNKSLRNLYYGEDILPKRVEGFLALKNVGEQTLSQFLVIFDNAKYPLISDQNRKMLNINTNIEEQAKKLALEKYNVNDSSLYSSRTISFLTYGVILEKIKEFLNFELYDWINMFLWMYETTTEGENGDQSPDDLYITLELEKDLRKFLAKNPSAIEQGLSLVEGGEEYQTDAGNIDLLLKDTERNYVVVELKRAGTGDKVMGQILRYIGWVQENLSEKVRGIIVLGEPHDKLDYALKPVSSFVQVKYYRVKFEVSDVFQN